MRIKIDIAEEVGYLTRFGPTQDCAQTVAQAIIEKTLDALGIGPYEVEPSRDGMVLEYSAAIAVSAPSKPNTRYKKNPKMNKKEVV